MRIGIFPTQIIFVDSLPNISIIRIVKPSRGKLKNTSKFPATDFLSFFNVSKYVNTIVGL
jgi:hypothetical protein